MADYGVTHDPQVHSPLGNIAIDAGVPRETIREVSSLLASPELRGATVLGLALTPYSLDVSVDDAAEATEDRLERLAQHEVTSLEPDRITVRLGTIAGYSDVSTSERLIERVPAARGITQVWSTNWSTWYATEKPSHAAAVVEALADTDEPLGLGYTVGVRDAPLDEPAQLQIETLGVTSLVTETRRAARLLDIEHVTGVHLDALINTPLPVLTVTVEAGIDAEAVVRQFDAEHWDAPALFRVQTDSEPVITFDSTRNEAFADLPGVPDSELRAAFERAWAQM